MSNKLNICLNQVSFFSQTIRSVSAGMKTIERVTEDGLAIHTNFLIQIFYFTQLPEVYL